MLDTLRSESISTGLGDGSRPPTLEVEGECTYYSPTDDMAMEKVCLMSVLLHIRSSVCCILHAGLLMQALACCQPVFSSARRSGSCQL